MYVLVIHERQLGSISWLVTYKGGIENSSPRAGSGRHNSLRVLNFANFTIAVAYFVIAKRSRWVDKHRILDRRE